MKLSNTGLLPLLTYLVAYHPQIHKRDAMLRGTSDQWGWRRHQRWDRMRDMLSPLQYNHTSRLTRWTCYALICKERSKSWATIHSFSVIPNIIHRRLEANFASTTRKESTASIEFRRRYSTDFLFIYFNHTLFCFWSAHSFIPAILNSMIS